MKRAVYRVTFELEINLSPEEVDENGKLTAHAELTNEVLIEEAIEMLLDEELYEHGEGGTRCGLNFNDAIRFEAEFLEVRS
jgi:hypothetical protein